MSYHDLSECTLTPDERRAETDRILEMFGTGAILIEACTVKEQAFINSLRGNGYVSKKQLFWLRDIKDRAL